MTISAIPQREALRIYLAAVAGNEPVSSHIELRWRATEGFRQEFWPVRAIKSTAERIEALGPRGDVYVGAAPRTSQSGRATAVARSWLLWADCDDDSADDALEQFNPEPSIVVRSGTGQHRHAYWPLREPLPRAHIARANKRVAHALGADIASTDPARILRPPGTLNFKSRVSTAVECVRLELATFTARDVVAHLPDPVEAKRRAPTVTRDLDAGDALRSLAAADYAPLLTGRDVGRNGKMRCPFHEERTPSLHAYSAPERGWRCFGCQRGGSIVDFGAALYGIEPRGRGFHDIRRRLASDLLGRMQEMAA